MNAGNSLHANDMQCSSTCSTTCKAREAILFRSVASKRQPPQILRAPSCPKIGLTMIEEEVYGRTSCDGSSDSEALRLQCASQSAVILSW